ncbi:hypothetical protein BpHYR1_010503 [Brachionus plicatilis]|uniref:Uncharacterized protein n=1 Tax=Brachionus plicatilis TaxID=10195 RepID=A0A3M7SI81_BRAPC|nr:hypothetical protein BpHYR1_010503 [Brachionus plicatilis]
MLFFNIKKYKNIILQLTNKSEKMNRSIQFLKHLLPSTVIFQICTTTESQALRRNILSKSSISHIFKLSGIKIFTIFLVRLFSVSFSEIQYADFFALDRSLASFGVQAVSDVEQVDEQDEKSSLCLVFFLPFKNSFGWNPFVPTKEKNLKIEIKIFLVLFIPAIVMNKVLNQRIFYSKTTSKYICLEKMRNYAYKFKHKFICFFKYKICNYIISAEYEAKGKRGRCPQKKRRVEDETIFLFNQVQIQKIIIIIVYVEGEDVTAFHMSNFTKELRIYSKSFSLLSRHNFFLKITSTKFKKKINCALKMGSAASYPNS